MHLNYRVLSMFAHSKLSVSTQWLIGRVARDKNFGALWTIKLIRLVDLKNELADHDHEMKLSIPIVWVVSFEYKKSMLKWVVPP